jgi:hypothetical protein
VLRWYLRISLSAVVPGLYRLLRGVPCAFTSILASTSTTSSFSRHGLQRWKDRDFFNILDMDVPCAPPPLLRLGVVISPLPPNRGLAAVPAFDPRLFRPFDVDVPPPTRVADASPVSELRGGRLPPAPPPAGLLCFVDMMGCEVKQLRVTERADADSLRNFLFCSAFFRRREAW